MLVFLNGEFVPPDQARVSVADRGFRYGDGLFETLRFAGGAPLRWEAHWARLDRGAQFLNLRCPFSSTQLLEAARCLGQHHALPAGVLRLTVTRGPGPRGYSPKGADHPTVVMELHPAPPAPATARVVLSALRLPVRDPLSAFKTCNKLGHVLARAEADARGADDALLANGDGHLAEATASNLFWVDDHDTVCTPPLATGALDGVTRAAILRYSRDLGLAVEEVNAGIETLPLARGVFLTRTTAGVVEVIEVDGRPVPSAPIVARLREAWERESASVG